MQESSTMFAPPAHIPGPDEPCFLIKTQGAPLYWSTKERAWVQLGRATQFNERAAYVHAAGISPWVCDVVRGR